MFLANVKDKTLFINEWKQECTHEWRQYSNSDRYYCIHCLAQVVLEDNLKDSKVIIRQQLKGLL